jgi:hypothetical protein
MTAETYHAYSISRARRTKADIATIRDAVIEVSGCGTRNISATLIFFPGRRIEPERDGEGWLVTRGEHGWLHGDRAAALAELRELNLIERGW